MAWLPRVLVFVASGFLIAGVASAADGGLDAGSDASVSDAGDASADASSVDATTKDATVDAGVDATPIYDGSDVEVGTFVPDGANPVPDAGGDAGAVASGCSCSQAGGPEVSSALVGAAPGILVGFGIVLAFARRRRRSS